MMKVLIMLLCMCHYCDVMGKEAASDSHDLAGKMEKLEYLLSKTIQESEKQKKIIEDLQAQLGEQAHIIDKLQSENESNRNSYVSFTATASDVRDYDKGDHVLFDSIIRNYGDSYFADNSTFICSHSAYYLFSTSIRSVGGSGMHAEIMLDNSGLVRAWATVNADDQMASNQVVTYCAAGQSVWVRCGYGQGNQMIGGSPYSTFSGTLLRLA